MSQWSRSSRSISAWALSWVVITLFFVNTCTNAAKSDDKAALEAEAVQLRKQAKQQPGNAMVQLQLATTLHKLNHLNPDGGRRIPEAEQAYRSALATWEDTSPLYVNILGNLATLLLNGNNPDIAVAELQQAIQLAKQQQQPAHQSAGLLFNLGKAFTTIGKLSEADAAYLEAAAVAYGHDLSSYGKALAAAKSIRSQAAMQAAMVAKAAHQHFAKQEGLGFLKEVQLESAHEQQKHDAVHETTWIQQADSVDLVWLHFALYRYHHSNMQYKEAWEYLALGNQLMAAHIHHDPAADRMTLQQIKSIFRAPFLQGGYEDETPIFVGGMPRSGSTLVEQILASHSQVFAAGEDTALAPLTPNINKALATPGTNQAHVLRKYGRKYVALMRNRVPTDIWLDPETQGPIRIVDKMLRNLWLVGYIHMLLPKACIVLVARHPMDVALSCYAQPFGYSASTLSWAWNLAHIADQLEMSWKLVDHWHTQLPGRIHTVLYEELVSQPEAVARSLLSACGLSWEPAVLQFQATERPVHTASMVQVRQPLYTSSVGRWKVYEHQLRDVYNRLGPLISRYEQLLEHRMKLYEEGHSSAVPNDSSKHSGQAGDAQGEAGNANAAGKAGRFSPSVDAPAADTKDEL